MLALDGNRTMVLRTTSMQMFGLNDDEARTVAENALAAYPAIASTTSNDLVLIAAETAAGMYPERAPDVFAAILLTRIDFETSDVLLVEILDVMRAAAPDQPDALVAATLGRQFEVADVGCTMARGRHAVDNFWLVPGQ